MLIPRFVVAAERKCPNFTEIKCPGFPFALNMFEAGSVIGA